MSVPETETSNFLALSSSRHSAPAGLGLLGLLWLVGNSLRVTVLAIPPLLPAIHQSLGLDEKLVGALSGLPILLLAIASVPGSYVISRLGARRSLLLGLTVTALGGAARGIGTSAGILFFMTFVMALGIAVSQPALPTLARDWFGTRAGLATAVYSNGFLVGEIVAASLTVPLVLPLVADSWQLALAVWSVPVLLTVVILPLLAPRAERDAAVARDPWWPDWRNANTWRLGLIFGCGSIAYFGSNAFLPDYLKATHHGAWISLTLACLNIGQLPASFLVAGMPRLIGRRWPVLSTGVLLLVSVLGFVVAESWIPAWAALLGFSSALVFVLSLALPPLIAGAGDVHRLSAAMFTLSYTCAAVASFLGGAVWDATGVPETVFTPVFAAGAAMLLLAGRLRPQPMQR